MEATTPEPWAAGWPRQRMEYRHYTDGDDEQIDRLPCLFIGGKNQADNDWLNFADDAAEAARQESACVVCGERLNRTVVFGHFQSEFGRGANPSSNGPASHPRCFALAMKFCPHYNRKPYTAKRFTLGWVYKGDDWVEAVMPMLRYDPKGDPLPATRQDSLNAVTGTYDLRRRLVKAHTRSECIARAKTDPLGLGATP